MTNLYYKKDDVAVGAGADQRVGAVVVLEQTRLVRLQIKPTGGDFTGNIQGHNMDGDAADAEWETVTAIAAADGATASQTVDGSAWRFLRLFGQMTVAGTVDLAWSNA